MGQRARGLAAARVGGFSQLPFGVGGGGLAEARDSPGCGGAGRGGERGRGGGEVRPGRCPQQLRVQDINLVLCDLGHVVEVFLRGWGGKVGLRVRALQGGRWGVQRDARPADLEKLQL